MQLREIVEKLPTAKVLVVGDPMIDVYHFGRVDRICPEGPVPIFVKYRTEERRGGASNVAANVTALQAYVTSCFAPVASVKTRFMVDSHLLLRQDADMSYQAGKDDVDALCHFVSSVKGKGYVVILSDYGRGWVNNLMSELLIDVCKRQDTPILVDPAQGADWGKYRGCSLICPNEKEARDAPYLDPRSFPRVLFKKGAEGMTLALGSEEIHIAAKARHVYDVTGAGDTVIAVMATAISIGASYQEAAELAAIAAGHVVGEVGTAVCPLEKLKELVDGAY